MSQRLLEGNVDNRDALIETLTEEKADLERQLREARADLAKAQRALKTKLAPLQHQIQPWYDAMRRLMEDVEEMVGNDGHAPAAAGPAIPERVQAAWQHWKNTLGTGPAKVIDALLVHGELNTQQLAIAIGAHRTTVRTYIYALNKAGLINKNAGRFSLKQL